MIAAGILLLGLVVAYLAAAVVAMIRLGIGFQQALLYVPFSLCYRIDDRRVRVARKAQTPVIYTIVHQSRLDPALMLALLPGDTLHILDPQSAAAGWLEPWRALARTIAFNAEHVFVSRRLVSRLKAGGRLAVYLPDAVEPDTKTFRLYRAVARIALKADARIVPIFVGGARHLPSSFTPPEQAKRRWFPRLAISVCEPVEMDRLVNPLPDREADKFSTRPTTASNALFDRVAEARFAATDLSVGLFGALLDAADRHGIYRAAVEDMFSNTFTYRRLFIAARALGRRFAAITPPQATVGLLLPNASSVAVSLTALFSASRTAAMINYTAGPASVTASVRTAMIRTVVASRAFVEEANLEEIVAAVEAGGAKIFWLEDIQASISALEMLKATLFWRQPLASQDAENPAIILFTAGSEGEPKAVVLSHRNLLANVAQIGSRIAFSPHDTLFNVLPVFHSFGLTGGTLLPLLSGVRLFLYPSPLHYRLIPETVAKVKPTIMFGTDTFLSAYARTASDDDFSSLRLVVAGAEAVKPETRKIWRTRFGAEIVEGFGLTEAAPVVAVNSATHNRDGAVGRLLPAIRFRLEPVDGVDDGGKLWISGPNIMLGYMTAERAGELQPCQDGWLDTGDIVGVDREGFVSIRGRAKRFAKIAGEMVSLGAIEMFVQSLWPEDRHAVVSVSDKRRGERVVLVTTASKAELNELHQHCKKSGVKRFMAPQEIVKVRDMPVLGAGKTDYETVRRLVAERLGYDAAA